jgi:hypothetical protein
MGVLLRLWHKGSELQLALAVAGQVVLRGKHLQKKGF